MATLLPNVKQRFFDLNGAPLAGGKLYSYVATTTTPLATYIDQSEGTPNANPTILDANGEANVWIKDAAYKFTLTDASDVPLWTVDNVINLADGTITTAKLADGSVTTIKIADLAVTTAKIQDNAVITSKIADNAVTAAKIPDGSLAIAKLASTTDILFKDRGPAMINGGMRVYPRYPWSSPTLIANPSSLPGAKGLGAKWSPDGYMLAIPENAGSFASFFLRSGNTIKKVGLLDLTPAVAATSAAFSPNGEFIALTHAGAFYVEVYQRCGGAYKRILIFGTSPTGDGNGCAFSPNNEFLAVAHNTSPYVTVYQLSEGASNVSARYTSDAGASYSSGVAAYVNFEDISYDPLSCVTIGASWVFTAKRSNLYNVDAIVTFGTASGGTWTTDELCELHLYVNNSFVGVLDSIPSYASTSRKMSVSGSDAIYLNAGDTCSIIVKQSSGTSLLLDTTAGYNRVAISEAPGFNGYTVFTKISNPATLPAGNATGVCWSPDSFTLVVTHATSPYFSIYSRSGTTLTKLSDPATLPTGTVTGAAFSHDGVYLALSVSVSPYVIVYQRSGNTFTKLTNPLVLPAGAGAGVAWYPDDSILAVAHTTTPFVTLYDFDGTTLTKKADPSLLPAGDATGVSWTPDGRFLTVSHANTPYQSTYQTADVIPSDAVLFVKEANLV